MAWRCDGCKRYWGYCKMRLALLMILRKRIPDAVALELILDFVGSKATVSPLPRRSPCFSGGPRNCRCNGCRTPDGRRDDRILQRLARKAGRGRAFASRWVHLLSGTVALRAGHGILHGMLLAADCGRGPHVSFLRSRVPELLCNDIRPWVWRWLTALFLQYVDDRCGLKGLLGTASSVLLDSSIA